VLPLFISVHRTGPLLWHFEENTTSDPSIELDLEEIKALAGHIGFEIKVCTFVSIARFSYPRFTPGQNERTVDTTYVNNKESMLGYIYHSAFWTATKKL
jgi:carnosine N-methyltransferase